MTLRKVDPGSRNAEVREQRFLVWIEWAESFQHHVSESVVPFERGISFGPERKSTNHCSAQKDGENSSLPAAFVICSTSGIQIAASLGKKERNLM
jgi:hypothetical protein